METITLAEAMKRTFADTEKRSKYGNVHTEYKGRMYHSAKEAEYAQFLDAMRRAKHEKDRVVRVEPQVPYKLAVNGVLVCKYYLDFKVTYADGRIEHVDVKGVKTDVYKLKKKLMKACHGIDIIET